jgi:hypothetical protein
VVEGPRQWSELRRAPLLRGWVNKGKRGVRCQQGPRAQREPSWREAADGSTMSMQLREGTVTKTSGKLLAAILL